MANSSLRNIMGRFTVSAKSVIGTHVENWEGENLGNITDIMLEKEDGEIAYLELSYPGDYGRRYPNKRFAVPFEAIAKKIMDGKSAEYIMDVQEEFLQQAPGYDTSNPPDFADKRFGDLLKDYYKNVSVDIRV